MSCWRVLELSDSGDLQHVPQLLIKPKFAKEEYTIFLTDLSNIWSEHLDLEGITRRAQEQGSPIEVTQEDTSQLAILLDNVCKSLSSSEDAFSIVSQEGTEDLVLHTSIRLPEPLDSLNWKFHFVKRTPIILKNELILPLLVSSHIQHERVNKLTSLINEKDKAIIRLVDQFESSNMDLAGAFPSIAGAKAGRRLIKSEQAAKYVPALRRFEEDAWKQETAELKELNMCTLALFQEALSECTPKVPPSMQSREDAEDAWWTSLPNHVSSVKPSTKPKAVASKPQTKTSPVGTSDDETEDEFETHEHFNLRKSPRISTRDAAKFSRGESGRPPIVSENDSTEDDDDLDAAPRSQKQRLIRRQFHSPRQPTFSQSPEQSREASPRSGGTHAQKPKGFRIGGAKRKEPATQSQSLPVAAPEEDSVEGAEQDNDHGSTIPARYAINAESSISAAAKPLRRPFKIGGKHNDIPQDMQARNDVPMSRSASEAPQSSAPVHPSTSRALPHTSLRAQRGETAESVHHREEPEKEETAEEKAERRRHELKRKTEEELAKKQTQKKKKRF